MQRISRLLLSNSLATAVSSPNCLNDTFRSLQRVWNVDFQNGPATTRALSFHEVANPAAPIFHILDLDGSVASTSLTDSSPNEGEFFEYRVLDERCVISRPVAERILRTMVVHNAMDKILLEAQRQGRISFYMTMFGEEAAVVGAAAGLQDHDEVFMQYREAGILTYRGYTIPQFIAQCMGNCECDMKGRQMPIHYGNVKLHAQMISSPLATQIPHGAGAGYAIRLENEALLKKEPPGDARICATFFGEGAASEGDFHAGINFASTVGSHTLFFVRNNGYAISTPTHDQYSGDGVMGKAIGYGIPAARVDGSDVLAVYHTVRKAREIILSSNTPVLVEALTYRLSHHSTSDDSTAYRSRTEIEHVAETFSAIGRFENFMINRGWWARGKSEDIAVQVRQEVLRELRRQEKLPPWPVETICDDVFAELTPSLQKDKEDLMEHYRKHQPVYDREQL